MKTHNLSLALLLLLILIALTGVTLAAPLRPTWTTPPTAASLIIGVPFEDAGSTATAGIINLIYGIENSGLITLTSEYFGQTASAGETEAGDQYGSAVVSGDFNRDGYFDIAVGVPYENDGSYVDVGAVNILYGSQDGFTRQVYIAAGQITDQIINNNDHFGQSLAACDFDGDGYTDLIIGAPGYNVGSWVDTGGVFILYGSPTGLVGEPNTLFDYYTGTGYGSNYGHSIACADFNEDGYDDIVVGVPYDRDINDTISGAIYIQHGIPRDVQYTSGEGISQECTGYDTNESGDMFGWAVAVGDWNNDGHSDIAVGVPGEDLDSHTNAGVIHVMYGDGADYPPNGSGFPADNGQLWSQDTILIPGTGTPQNPSESDDFFGRTLVTGDFNGDGCDDLAIGAPLEDQDASNTDTGLTQVLFGVSGQGLDDGQNAIFIGSEDSAEMGSTLAAGDFDGDGCDDLAIGLPNGGSDDEGAVVVYYGDPQTARGFSTDKHALYTQDDLPGSSAENSDHFGAALAILPAPLHRLFLPTVLRG